MDDELRINIVTTVGAAVDLLAKLPPHLRAQIRIGDHVSERQPTGIAARILEMVEEKGQVTRKEIMAELGVSGAHASMTASRLIARGLLSSPARGVYAAPEA